MRAGVSLATASYALNGKPVGQASRERVVAAARELNYVPRASAQALKTGRTGVIGLLVLNRPGTTELTEDSSFFYRLIRGVLAGVEAAEMSLTFGVMTESSDNVKSSLDRLSGRHEHDAFVLVPQWRNDGSYARILRERGVPTVTINDGGLDDRSSVRIDEAHGMEEALRYLHEHGHRSISYLAGPSEHLDAEARIEAYTAVCQELGIEVGHSSIRRADFTISGGADGMRSLLDDVEAGRLDMPTAVLTADDFAAAGALQVAAARGLSVPADLSIVGYDDVDVARATVPPLTTVRLPLVDLGRRAAQIAIAMALGQSAEHVERVVMPELIVRGSVAQI